MRGGRGDFNIHITEAWEPAWGQGHWYTPPPQFLKEKLCYASSLFWQTLIVMAVFLIMAAKKWD